jgi:hypothetical protein
MGEGSLFLKGSSISIPYVEGDFNGQMTSALIEAISENGIFRYQRSGGKYLLLAKIIDFDDEDIGFRYEKKKDGKYKSAVIPDETRLFVEVEVTLIDTSTQQNVLGPVRIISHTDFDHDYYSSRNAVNVFSLGQLTDYDAAYEAAYIPLSRELAKKIVAYLNSSW